jgi:hypothetical protein
MKVSSSALLDEDMTPRAFQLQLWYVIPKGGKHVGHCRSICQAYFTSCWPTCKLLYHHQAHNHKDLDSIHNILQTLLVQ